MPPQSPTPAPLSNPKPLKAKAVTDKPVFRIKILFGSHVQPEVTANGDYVKDSAGHLVEKEYTALNQSDSIFYAVTDLSNGGQDRKFQLLS